MIFRFTKLVFVMLLTFGRQLDPKKVKYIYLSISWSISVNTQPCLARSKLFYSNPDELRYYPLRLI